MLTHCVILSFTFNSFHFFHQRFNAFFKRFTTNLKIIMKKILVCHYYVTGDELISLARVAGQDF